MSTSRGCTTPCCSLVIELPVAGLIARWHGLFAAANRAWRLEEPEIGHLWTRDKTGRADPPPVAEGPGDFLPQSPGAELSDDRTRRERSVPTWSAVVVEELGALGCRARLSGWKRYPVGGFIRWHTDAHRQGGRLYFVEVEDPGRSRFAYQCPTHQVVTVLEETACAAARVYQLGSGPTLFPHASETATVRHVGGFFIDSGLDSLLNSPRAR